MKSEDKTVNYYSINFLYVILFIVVCLLGAWAHNTICPPQYAYYLGVFVGVFSFSFFLIASCFKEVKILDEISHERD